MPAPKHPYSRRRRNITSSPERTLPSEGNTAPTPICPLPLGSAGEVFWEWAWSTPQSTQWGDAHTWPLAMLAAMHDDWAQARSRGDEGAQEARMHWSAISRTYPDFGLTPKSLALMHSWIDTETPEMTPVDVGPPVADIRDRIKGLGAG